MKVFVFLTFFLIIIYGGFLFITCAIYTACDKDLTIISYFYPMMIMFFFGFGTYIANKISECLYSTMYIITGTLTVFELYSFLFSCIHQIIEAFTDLPLVWGLSIILIVPALCCIFGLINVNVIHIDNVTLTFKGFKGKRKIAHLSDIHLGAIYKKGLVQKLVNKVNELKPDVVVITGDMADGTMRVKSDWLSPFDSLTMPILYITGNHEALHGKQQMINAVEATNIKHIGNEVYQCCDMNFIGVDFEYDLNKRLTTLSPHYSNSELPNILLCHIPSMKPEELEKYNIFLFLAGHTHGGQIFPFQLFAYLGNACFNGLYSYNNHHIYVSPGVAAAVAPMRIGSTSTIALITIQG